MNAEKSEVQNLTDPAQATEGLDESPPASETGHVAQGEPRDYAAGETAIDDAALDEGDTAKESHDS